MLKVNNVYNIDCIEGFRNLPDNSIDSIVTDPPYEIGMMGQKWDSTGIAYNVEMWKECLRVLKHGGFLVSFSSTRTYHRMTCAIEDAGFEIVDMIPWIQSQGFPKSRDVSKLIDKKLGAEREVIGKRVHPTLKNPPKVKSRAYHVESLESNNTMESWDITAPATDEAKKFNGYGTSLKPANEPTVLARKPLSENTLVDNVLRWGTGGINIDGSRIPRVENDRFEYGVDGDEKAKKNTNVYGDYERVPYVPNELGRFPSNVILGEEAADYLDVFENGASKFFYCAKASKRERNSTWQGIEIKEEYVTLREDLSNSEREYVISELEKYGIKSVSQINSQ